MDITKKKGSDLMLERMVSLMERISDRSPVMSLVAMQVIVPACLLMAVSGTVLLGGGLIYFVERMLGLL